MRASVVSTDAMHLLSFRMRYSSAVAFSLFVFVSKYCVRAQDLISNGTCSDAMRTWVNDQRVLFPVDRPVNREKLLYFLHVPRTGGRTSHSCFLRPASPPSRRCAKSYDGFKYNISVPHCGLFASHDDYSALSFLPKESAVITSIRNPVDRFLSAYEFGVELGVRHAVSKIAGSNRADKTSTMNVWPWSSIQPFFHDDVVAKVIRVYIA